MKHLESEIYARVYIEGSDLYSLTDNGRLNESKDLFTNNQENETILWFEIEEGDGKHYPTITEAKQAIEKRGW